MNGFLSRSRKQQAAVGRVYADRLGHLKRFGPSVAHLLITQQQTLDTHDNYLYNVWARQIPGAPGALVTKTVKSSLSMPEYY
jgi:hypothetical protein